MLYVTDHFTELYVSCWTFQASIKHICSKQIGLLCDDWLETMLSVSRWLFVTLTGCVFSSPPSSLGLADVSVHSRDREHLFSLRLTSCSGPKWSVIHQSWQLPISAASPLYFSTFTFLSSCRCVCQSHCFAVVYLSSSCCLSLCLSPQSAQIPLVSVHLQAPGCGSGLSHFKSPDRHIKHK